MPWQPLPSPQSQPPVAPSLELEADRRNRARPEKGPHPTAHTVPFEVQAKSCSSVLSDLLQTAPAEGMTVRALIHALGERGLLMACMLFTIPSLLPIPIPGMSIPQGMIIALIGLGIVLNRAPLLPERLLEYRLQQASLRQILEKGASVFQRIEKLSFPRLLPITQGWVHALNGIMVVAGALVLASPFPIPFSNVLPAYGILFLAFGTLQRDGWLVLAGYFMYLVTAAYLTAVFLFGMAGIYRLFR